MSLVSGEEDIENDVNDNDAGFSDAVSNINIETHNRIEETEYKLKISHHKHMKMHAIYSNEIVIRNSGALKDLIDVIKDGDFSTAIEAVSAVFHLCILFENQEKAVS
ncbi:hypothetical protein Bca52824_051063 [Brassica carinata]|uniref:Uncharacterized protein n=1 Tax=Brassica carinata TaxID=52824 RepID=A0A8X7R4R7_BRACI|nr:hypothetical protein Bca52824_051063 [Brassica carinata]